MAKTNPFLQSPFQALIDKQAEPIQLPGSDLVTDVEVPDLSEAPEQPAAQVAQPAAPVPKKAKAKPASLIPPADLMPVFSASASHFGVPENVLMAIAQQESSYDPEAVNSESGAEGIAQYMGATAKSLGINARDPNEAIPATAMQIAERLAKGMSLEDAVKEHFAGPDRKKWGSKTAAYGKSVLEKAEAIGRELYKDLPASEPEPAVTADSTPLPNFGVAPDALKRIQAQWNAATPDERKQMEAIRGPRGYIARELNKRHPAKQPAANPLGLDIDPMSQVNEAYKNPTLDSIDPRAEARARNLVNQGMEGNTANKVARAAALAGMTPGTEPGIGQRIENTDFDFATRKKYQEDPFFSNPAVRGAVKGYEGYKRGILGLNQMAAEVLGADNLAGSLSEAGAESRESEAAMGEADTYGQRMFEGAVSSIAQQVPALIGGAATGSEALVLGTMFAQTFGSEYSEGRARGQNEEQAMGRAALYGTFEVVGEKLGLGDTLRGLRGAVDGATTKDVATSMARALLKEIPGEQLTTLGQFGTDQLGGGYGLNTEAGLAEYLQQAADTAVQTVIQGGIMGGVTTGAAAVGNRIAGPRPAQTGAQAPSTPLDAGPEGRVEPVMGDTPAEPQQIAPSGPLTAALSEAAGVTEEDGFTAQVMGDDGQMYTVDSRAGVVAPAEEVAAGPLESALMEAAELHDADPAPMPAMPEPEPQAPDYTAMPVEELKTQVQQLAAQDKQATDPEQRKKIRAERKTVEKEIGARAKQAQLDSKPAEEPMSMGPFDDIKTANKMMMRYAEKTSVPHEVVEKDGKFRIQPLEASDGLDTAGASGRDDGRGRSGEPAAGVGVSDGAGRAGTGTVSVGESGVPAGERGDHASVNRVVADEAANPDSAVARNPYAAYSASKPEFAESYMDKRGVDRSKYEVQQTGPVRWQIVPRAAQDIQTTTQAEEVADVSKRQEVPEEAQAPSGAQSTVEASASDRAESADAGVGTSAAPSKPKRKVNESVARRQAANARQEEAVEKAKASLAARAEAKKVEPSDATPFERVAAVKAEPMLDLSKRSTGWKQIPIANGDGVVLVSYDGKKSVRFENPNPKSGTEALRTYAKGQAYAIDNPYVGETSAGELVIEPVFKKAAESAEPQQAAVEQPPAPIQQEAKPKRKPAAKKKAELVEEAEGVRYSVSGGLEYPIAPRDEWYGEGTFEQSGGRMVMVTPDEYIAAVRPLTMDEESRENIDLLKEHIENGGTLDPLLIRANGKEDGRHRAYAAKELGIKRVPVIAYGDQLKDAKPAQTERYSVSGDESLDDVRAAWDAAGIKNFISERNGVISLSQIVVPKEGRGAGAGTKAMQQLIEYAERTNQRIVLTPSSDFGGNKARLVQFYKRFGFVENKGRTKDYEVSEAMYRDPQGVRYSVSGDVTDSPAFRVWFGDSKVVDEQGRPLVVYHGTHADITQFKKTKGAHLGFHFGDQEAANTRLEDTSDSRIDKEEVARINARAEAFFNELKTFENHLQHKTPEIPQDELLAALEAGEDVGAIFDRYKYKPTNEEAAELDRLQRQYKAAQLPIMKTGIGSNIGAYFLAIRRPLRMPDVGHWGSVKEVRAALPWNSEARSIAQVVEEIKSRGYDGIVYKNRVENPVMQTDSYIAFEPEQIKSAIGNNGEFNPNNPDIRYSADESDTDYSLLDLPMLADSLPVLDSFVETLASAGIIKLHANASTLPVKGKVPQGVQALTTADGKIHVVANALNNNAKGVVLHEAFHAGVKSLVGTKVWGDLMQRLGALHKQGQSTSGAANAFWKAAKRRVTMAQLKGAVAPGMEAEEFGAYAIEEYATAPLTVKKWVDDLIGAIKAWVLRRFGAQLGKVTPAQLMALAKVALLDVAQSRQQEAFSTKRTSDIVVDEELLDVAKAETADLPIMRLEIDVERDQQGVIPGKPTSINESLKRGRYTIEQMSDAWSRTRAMLRERYGDTVTLYRADAPQHEWHEDTQVVYMGDEKLARRFVDSERKMQAFNVPVDDIIGVNALSNGYYEFIVKRQDGSAKFSVDRRTEDRGTADRRKTIEFQGQRRPIENSKGQLIAEDMNKQLAFYKWFKDSAVVDEQQRPLVVYHGTRRDFDTFDRAGMNFNQRYGKGFYFTETAAVASSYADSEGGRVLPVYLALSNPLVVSGDKQYREAVDAERERLAGGSRYKADQLANAEPNDVLAQAGYDGVIYEFNGRKQELVAFKPDHIKSAVGNSGEFSESNPDIRFSVSGSLPAGAAPAQANAQAQDRSLTPPEQGLLRRVQAQIQDSFNRVKQVQERITELTGVKDLGGADVYRAETNRPGRIAARKEDGRDKLFKPLMERLAKSGYTPKQLETLLHAQHAVERNEKVAGINPEFSDGGSGMRNKRAGEVLAEFPEQDHAELYEMADQARTIAREILKLKLSYGLISQDDFDALDDNYEFYVPLKGDGEYGFRLKRAMGHDEREEHILENIARDYEQAIVAGEKNLARQSLLQMILKHPDDELWTARIPPKGRRVVHQGHKWVVTHNGMTLGEFDSEVEANRQSELWATLGGDHFMNYEVQRESAGEKVKDFVLPLQDHEILVYVKGDAVRLQIFDEKLVRQLRPLKSEQMNAVLELMRKHNRYLSMIFTGYNPAFIIKNASRDAITGTINMTGNHGAATAAKAWAKYPMAWATMLKWAATKKVPDTAMGRMLTEYRAQGGKVGASYMSDLEEQGKSLQRMFDDAKGVKGYAAEGKVGKAAWIAARKAVGGAAHAVEIVNQAFENALRLALFAQLRAEGKKPGVAAAAAKSVTVNFDRKGAMTAQMGAFYLFINPAIQGTANATITLTKGEHKYQAWALTGMMAAAGFGMAAMGMDDDKDRWLGEKWDTRTKNLRLRVGETTINIPMSQEFAPFYAIGVAMGEVARGESTMKAAANVMTSFLDAYYPMQGAVQPDSDNPSLDLLLAHIPTVGKAAAQIATNRNSFGSKVVPETDNTKNRPDNLKMSRSTKGSVYDKAAQALATGKPYENDLSKVSPETIKLLWSTYTGGLGRFVADTVGAGNLARQADVDMDVSDVPIVKDFVKPDNVNAIRSRFYDLSDEAKKTVDEFNAAKKALDGDAMREITSDHVKKAHIGLARMVKSINEVQAIYAEQAVSINADKKLNDADKRARLKQLESEQEAIYRKAIQAFQQ